MEESYNHLNEEDRNRLSELKFYEDEIGYFKTRLTKVEADAPVNEKVDEFNQRLSEMLQTIELLRNLILKSERHLASRMELAHRMKVAVEEDHHSVKQLMTSFSQQYKSLKSDVNHFLSKAISK